MRIGVDLRVLQVGHQYRGIGEVAKRTLNEIFKLALEDTAAHQFVFYEFNDPVDPKEFLEIPKQLSYTEVYLGVRPAVETERSTAEKLRYKWRTLYGNPIQHAKECDVFLQFDYALGVPTNIRSVLIKHDIIPYIFWNDYFTSPWVHFKHRAARTTLRTILHNYEYKRVLKRSLRNATRIVCVSAHTRQDLHKYLHVPLKKMSVVHLGVSTEALKSTKGSNPSELFPTKPFLLFIGAVDARRRRVDDLIAAYNNLKADGHDIQLVLAGENFQAPTMIPNKVVRSAVLGSSYNDDILCMGYIDDATKHRLFKEAIAFVFPTTYEGFGIPLLEAMLLGCPTISYINSSIPEVGGKYALYAQDWQNIQEAVVKFISMTDKERLDFIEAAAKHAQTFSWQKTGASIYGEMTGK